MPAAKDEFTADDYAAAQEFGLTLDQIAEADAEIADLERLNMTGFHPRHFLDMSWADAILARPQPALQTEAPIEAALPQAEGQPVSFGEESPQPEPPLKEQKPEAPAPPEPPLKKEEPEAPAPPEPPCRTQEPEAPAPPEPAWRNQEPEAPATENAHSAGAGHHV